MERDETYTITVKAEGEGPPAELRLRKHLKDLLRRARLRCLDIRPGEQRVEKKAEGKWFPML
jgi:hypothetical protein